MGTDAYSNLMNTCKSPATKTGYAKALKYFIGYLGIPVNGYIQLLRKDPKLIEINLRDFILYLKKGHSSATVSLYLAGIRKFYDMNHVVLNWKWIRSFEGEKEKLAEDRPYTHEEIRMLVSSKTSRLNYLSSSISSRCLYLLYRPNC